ncbi:MAG: methylglyoxal synthase [Rhodobacteraceae bacterium]|nr:methylglyoxal synthase [Paracoccaceae bacterium]
MTETSTAALPDPAPGAIALVAHDRQKPNLAAWVAAHADVLRNRPIVATATTGATIKDFCPELQITTVASGPLGGDQQIGAMIVEGRVTALVFFPDPMTPMPHDVDVKALLRIALVRDIPCAFNRRSADLLMRSGYFQESQPAPTEPGS